MVERPMLTGFTAFKGGTGKTTVSFNVGMEFARPRGYGGVPARPVLFIDLDPQGQKCGETLLGMFERGPFRTTLVFNDLHGFEVYEATYDPTGFEDLVREDAPVESVWVARPRGRRLGGVTPESVRRLIRHYNKVTGSETPIALVDTPPMNLENDKVMAVLRECDLVVPVLEPTSVRQLERFVGIGMNVHMAVVNKCRENPYNPRVKDRVKKAISQALRNVPLSWEDIVAIEDSVVIEEATSFGIPVRVRFNPGGYAERFREVARKIAKYHDMIT